MGGVNFEGETVFTKAQLAVLYEVRESTIEKYLVSHADELKVNGYTLLRGKKLKEFKESLDGTVINYGTKTSVLGGQTKFINQRDESYLVSALQEENYHRQFTDALDKYVEVNKWTYARFTNLIYQSIFHENAIEYKKVLNLATKTNIREILYSEVLNLIASYESGIANKLEQASNKLGHI